MKKPVSKTNLRTDKIVNLSKIATQYIIGGSIIMPDKAGKPTKGC